MKISTSSKLTKNVYIQLRIIKLLLVINCFCFYLCLFTLTSLKKFSGNLRLLINYVNILQKNLNYNCKILKSCILINNAIIVEIKKVTSQKIITMKFYSHSVSRLRFTYFKILAGIHKNINQKDVSYYNSIQLSIYVYIYIFLKLFCQ